MISNSADPLLFWLCIVLLVILLHGIYLLKKKIKAIWVLCFMLLSFCNLPDGIYVIGIHIPVSSRLIDGVAFGFFEWYLPIFLLLVAGYIFAVIRINKTLRHKTKWDKIILAAYTVFIIISPFAAGYISQIEKARY